MEAADLAARAEVAMARTNGTRIINGLKIDVMMSCQKILLAQQKLVFQVYLLLILFSAEFL